MIYMLLFLTLIMLASAISVLFLKETIHAVIVMTVVSLLASILFLFVAAPDVAITEASIGSALTTIVFVVALRRTVVAEAKGSKTERRETE